MEIITFEQFKSDPEAILTRLNNDIQATEHSLLLVWQSHMECIGFTHHGRIRYLPYSDLSQLIEQANNTYHCGNARVSLRGRFTDIEVEYPLLSVKHGFVYEQVRQYAAAFYRDVQSFYRFAATAGVLNKPAQIRDGAEPE